MDLSGKVAVVTGAGAGLGRAEALELARAGASIVLNDLPGSADSAAAEIGELGAKCVVVEGDVGERSTADALVTAAMEQFGGLHVVVNNAGVLRDRMLFNMTDEEWDLVVRVHLRGHFLLSRNAVALWKQQSKAAGEPVYARIVNTSSEAFLLGSEGQANYAAAKAGIAALTVATARGTSRYGVRANAICPRARTQMTAHVFGDAPAGDDSLAPEHVAKFVAHLAGPSGDRINGQVFVVHGGMVALMAPPTVEQKFGAFTDLDGYFADRDPQRTFACTETMAL
ncbi:3-oxoacyl-[acyl-carrier protein] reductase [Lentzea albidocapillata subsp. violacea]|uniref:3-oxoacyl-[acyl-carrier protein] reductase n=1 Tax=Lentzea albidocapillata subsp. violacea TaxID=128104 RepID=A0A1G8R608_9PSEU|nr:SDR family NAD(P)-dependent oxidoreductase [Lentzea albidocapillata]SDJ12389.1 3-oxoacyl-[acyl-carrier protein] reductase [Lentzea albidocapillata subsp. violacea]